jgi:Xaa-Pro aminopeptidase
VFSGFPKEETIMQAKESETRILNLQRRLMNEGIDGALLISSVDVFYFTGSRQNAVLWVPSRGRPVHLVRKSYARAREESFLEDVRPFPASSEFPSLFGAEIRKIGLTFDVLPVQQYRFYERLLGDREFSDISVINRELRSVKSPFELEQMRASGRRLCEVFRQIPSFLKPGMRELDLAAEFECRLRKAGHEGYLRMRAFNQETSGLAVAGGNAAVSGPFDGPVIGRGLSAAAPYGPSSAHIEKNVPILVDYGIAFNGYIVDMTRIFVFGKLAPELERAFHVSLDIQEWLTKNLRPGEIWEELFAGSIAMAEAAGLRDYFMGYPGEQAKFVGHGVGLELDEFPVLAPKFKFPLQEGQTVAIEPKFVFPGLGAAGIENTFAVTESGGEKLTDLPDDIVRL